MGREVGGRRELLVVTGERCYWTGREGQEDNNMVGSERDRWEGQKSI